MKIFVNGRFRSHKMTGIQRYAHEITQRLDFPLLEPRHSLRGWRGHAWEQTTLPIRSVRGLLWSPCAAGPLISSKHVVTFHDLFPLDSPEWYQPVFAAAYRILLTSLSKTATHIIAVSQFTKNRLVERLKVQPSRVTVIHNGVDFKTFYRAKEQIGRSRSELRLPSDRYVLCVGSLEPRKNLGRLLLAWSEVVGDLPQDIWLVVAGSHDASVYNAPGVSSIPERVVFTGYVPETLLAGLYSGSLGFVYPSLGEGFGLPPLEAMACGVPVFASNRTSLPEVCGSAAIYGDPTDVTEIARGIKLLCSDASLRDRLRCLGQEQASRFTWDRAAHATNELLFKFTEKAGDANEPRTAA
ncbi:MAG: glycosyltransferase family 4 protein [Acidobacteriota bacterium]|nr:glycosyltransferase family 4 protein [Acidobacteriota bacterium]